MPISIGRKYFFVCFSSLFGGTVNGEAFLQLGKHFDFSIIRKERSHPLHLEALLLGQAGLLPEETELSYLRELLQNYHYLQQKYKLSAPVIKIHFTGLRPQGFPTIRLSQLAQLYELNDGLFSQILEVNDFKSIQKLFAVGVSEFWEPTIPLPKLLKK